MKKIALVLVLAVLMAGAVSATETRIITMGGFGNFLIDDANIYGYPALVTDYPYNVFAEVGEYNWGFPAAPSLMVVLTNDKEQSFGVLGIIKNRSHFPGIVDEAIGNSGAPFWWIGAPESKLELIYGKRLNNLAVGVDIELAGDEYKLDAEGDDNDVTESMGILGVKAGVKYGLSEDSWVDFSIGIDKNSWSYEVKDVKYSDQGKISFGLGGRIIYPMTEKLVLIPILGFNMVDASWESDVNDVKDSEELTNMGVNTGVGLNITPSENMKVIVGWTVGMNKYTKTPEDTTFNKIETTTLNMPTCVIGIEAPIRDWLCGRVGMTKSMTKIDMKTTEQMGDKDETTVTTWNHPFNMFYGLGITLGSFTLDAQIGADVLFEGPYLLSGQPNNFLKVSAAYNFE